jgi:hypothetical protein
MPKPKTQKKPPKAPTRTKSTALPAVATPAPKPEPIATPSAPPVAAVATPRAPKPRPAARTRRATASPAQRRGADLVRFLRIHTKKPYGARGQNALVALAKEVGHLANIELGDVVTVAEN